MSLHLASALDGLCALVASKVRVACVQLARWLARVPLAGGVVTIPLSTIALVVLPLCCLGVVSPAHAHPLVEDGVGAIERASFAEAIELFDRAAERDDLSVSDLVQLLEGRALAKRALRRDATDDLRRLAAVRPEHRFARHVPPELVQAFDAIPDERLRLRLEVVPNEGTLHVRTALDGDPGGLVRSVRLAIRSGEEWLEGEGEMEVELTGASMLSVHVRVVALGGAVVIEQGSAHAPWPLWVETSDSSEVVRSEALECEPVEESESNDGAVWAVALTGLAAVAALTTAVVILATDGPSSETEISGPRFVAMEFEGL